ncbi:MAG: aminoacetone oxidase family FAD-binding enzyme [Clostridiales bacterium]|nr:aminoacetone oxidase family FAD-binding enzyme [Clostridiales bacterium]
MQVLIIGCGASGAAAAIAAAEAGHSVTVLDKNRKPLKKLGVTGNGRGNLMNLGEPVFFGDRSFAHEVLSLMPPASVKEFLTGLGLSLTSDGEGRVYPSSYMASVAVDAFLSRMKELKVDILQNMEVTSIQPKNGVFCVKATESLYAPSARKKSGKEKKGELLSKREVQFTAERVILAAGGKAAPAHGTDGSAYALAEALGHSLITPRPALCPLLTEAKPIQGLDGIRVKAGLRLASKSGETLHQSSGEALFTAEGVSGIAAMQLARFAHEGCTLFINLTESLTGHPKTPLSQWIAQRIQQRGNSPLSRFLQGTAVPALQNAVLLQAGLSGFDSYASALSPDQRQQLANAIESFRLTVTGVKGFEAAQVTAGGICAGEISPETMESKRIPGLRFTGEILNVDGDCGGHNLLFAFASGLLAGKTLA